jgi:uncharacterized protein YjbI with pentapeptide repeats
MRMPRIAVGMSLVCLAVGGMQLIGITGARASGPPTCGAPPHARINLSGCDFAGAVLTNVNLQHSKLIDTDLRGAYLFNSEVNGSNLRGADLSDTCLGGLCGPPGNIGGQGANMAHTDLVGADLADAQGGYFSFSEVGEVEPGVDLAHANLTSANLTHTDLIDANLTRAKLKDANLTGATLTGTTFMNGLGMTVVVPGANLTGARWNNTICPDGTNSNDDGRTCDNNL